MEHRPWPSRDVAGQFGPGTYADWRETSLGSITEAIERRLILRLAGKVRGRSGLDVGCGDGALTSALSQNGAAHVVGCDIDPQMIARASAQVKRDHDDGTYRGARHRHTARDSATGRCQARKNPSPASARSRRLTMESLYCLFSMPQRLAARCGVSTSRT
jgi:SAM-dependent methyltransferase